MMNKGFLFISLLLICQAGSAMGTTAHLKDYASSGEDVTNVLQMLVDKFSTVVIDEGEWLLSGEIQLRSNVTIKGLSANKSILKRNGGSRLRGGMLFYTEKENTDSYTRHDLTQEFSLRRLKFRNIHFRDLTIDFNRSPDVLSDFEISGSNLFAIAFIRTANASVRRCMFKDVMTETHNNGYPAVVIYQSKGIKVQDNKNDRVSLVQSIYSKDVTVRGNHSVVSVGTAIEFIAGRGHRCIDNRIDRVFWNVSCIGVNSTDCIVKGNVVYANDRNVSCLTLGHEPPLFKADNTRVENNYFHSAGCRCILIQNGSNIVLKKNSCSCYIDCDSPELTSGCIVASGLSEGIHDIKVIHNTLTSLGDGSCGCVTYSGKGAVLIRNNTITSNRGVSILNNNYCEAEISHNTIYCHDYSVTSRSNKLKVINNTLTDGIISSSEDIDISNNLIEYTTHSSFLGTSWDQIVIDGNRIVNSTGNIISCVFLIDGSKKTKTYDIKKIHIKDNKVLDGEVREMVSVSSHVNAPQLGKVVVPN